jgi:rubrerythrin
MEEKLRAALVALDLAMQTERDGRAFYLRAAESTQNEQGRALFTRIADDELGHLAILEARRKALAEKGEWLPFDQGDPKPAPTTPIFAKRLREGELNPHTSDLSALRVAYLLEKDAVDFYSRAAEQTDDADGKKMYRFLVKMEQSHQDDLETEYKLLSEQFKSMMGFSPF